MVKSNSLSHRGPGFNSQHPSGNSQLSVTVVPGDSMASSDLCGHKDIWQPAIYANKIPIHIEKNLKHKFNFLSSVF